MAALGWGLCLASPLQSSHFLVPFVLAKYALALSQVPWFLLDLFWVIFLNLELP